MQWVSYILLVGSRSESETYLLEECEESSHESHLNNCLGNVGDHGEGSQLKHVLGLVSVLPGEGDQLVIVERIADRGDDGADGRNKRRQEGE